ncbi:MAG TPA: FliM/FliN family flagellar motor switch protein [Hyphomicrobiaceae bacterium]|nr:FliM/FliN family flagellar motor switch protein [Hyphomicrobiaceae bacterium]
MDRAEALEMASEIAEPRRLEFDQIFRDTRDPIMEVPAIRLALAGGTERSAVTIRETFGLDVGVTFHQGAQRPAAEALALCTGAVVGVYVISDWGARAFVALERSVLYRVLDAMYGGTGQISGPAAERELTALEQAVAGRFATAVMKEFQTSLTPLVSFDCVLEGVEPALAPELFEKDRGELVTVQMQLSDSGELVTIALPARGLELARDLAVTPIEEAPLEFDPNWSRDLEHNVGRAEIDIIAVAEGPPMLLCDVARLQQGSLIEFDAERLEYVRIISDGEPVFEGRLGQSKGHFSICIETPLTSAAMDPGGLPGAHVQSVKASADQG